MADAQQTTEQQDVAAPAGPTPPVNGAEPERTCYRCHHPVPPDMAVCPACGRKQFRVCFCGVAFAAELSQCPVCGTNWAKSIVRRRSRSEKIKPRALARSAVLGAFFTILGMGLLNLLVSALAQRATPDGTVPAHLGERAYYAWDTLSHAVAALFGALVGGLGYMLLIALAGAVVGALIYLLPARLARLGRGVRHRNDRVRRRRSRR